MRIGQIIVRGCAATRVALVGALLMFVLQAPLQVLGAFGPAVQRETMRGPGQQPDANQLLLNLSFSCGTFVLGLAVFFLFPLVHGGILGQVRDRLELPSRPPGQFATYARAFYARLLGSEALFMLMMFAVMVPVMCLGMGLMFQEMARFAPPDVAEGGPPPPFADPQQLTRQLLSRPAVLAGVGLAALLLSAVGMVYWVANCVVVADEEGVFDSWRKALRFCRHHLSAVLVVWLLNVVGGVLVSPLGLLGSLGVVQDPWVLVAVGLVYAAVIACWGLLLAGLVMSLYLARGSPAEQPEPAAPAPA
jgi:hypothetical protein